VTTEQIAIYGLCFQAGAIIASALGVAAIIAWNIRIARRRATLDILLSEQSHEITIKERTKFVSLKKEGNLTKWALPENNKTDELETIRSVLNRYELVAIGIERSALDGQLYKNWCRTTLVNDWIALKPFVMEIRANNKVPTIFCEFEALAASWANAGERPHV